MSGPRRAPARAQRAVAYPRKADADICRDRRVQILTLLSHSFTNIRRSAFDRRKDFQSDFYVLKRRSPWQQSIGLKVHRNLSLQSAIVMERIAPVHDDLTEDGFSCPRINSELCFSLRPFGQV